MNFKEKYTKEIAPALKEKLGLKSIMEVPKLQKITINMGVGEASKDKGVLENAVKDLEAICGQKPVITKARKAVSTFKIREQYPIGCKVTLRGSKMYDFFERLINLAIPREKDFRGLSTKSFALGSFWYYNKEIYKKDWQDVYPVSNVEYAKAMKETDIFILMSTEANLKKFDWDFVDQLIKNTFKK